MLDLGLLVLRAAGFLLAFTFGIQKIGWYIAGFHSNKAFSSIGLAPLIAKMGLPAAVILALWITFNESIGAFLIGCGLFTRVCWRAARHWAWPVRSIPACALYLIAFASLSLTGAGSFSIDRRLQIWKTNRSRRATLSNPKEIARPRNERTISRGGSSTAVLKYVH